MKQEQENHDNRNIVPLSSNEIKSILKSQSESIFEDKNISNNSNFVKKSLIDIALDFKSNQKVQEEKLSNNKTPHNSNNFEDQDDSIKNEQNIEEVKLDENKEPQNSINFKDESDSTKNEQNIESVKLDENNKNDDKIDDQVETKASNNQKEINNTDMANFDKVEEDVQSAKLDQDESITNVEIESQKQQKDPIIETKSDKSIGAADETQQALDSVRDAVSQSIKNNDDLVTKSLADDTKSTDDVSEKILRDYDDFKNFLSSLSTLSEEAIYEVFQNKILEISYELAGYQIDKMPEKYEKKIKSFLKNINCFEEKITIEINDKDFEALSKIKNFNKNEQKRFFVSNKDLSRGDIILNCDGMQYSEKSIYITKINGSSDQ